jgi:hypothetical protein
MPSRLVSPELSKPPCSLANAHVLIIAFLVEFRSNAPRRPFFWFVSGWKEPDRLQAAAKEMELTYLAAETSIYHLR